MSKQGVLDGLKDIAALVANGGNIRAQIGKGFSPNPSPARKIHDHRPQMLAAWIFRVVCSRMFTFIWQGVSLGFSAGALPGPFLSYLISVTLAFGWRRSIIVILTPLITDGPIIVLVVFILKQFPPQIVRVMQVMGGLYLLWIAYGVWKQFRAGSSLQSDAPPQSRTLMQGLVMNWLSPAPYIFWATINGPLLIQALNLSVVHAAAFMVAFYGTFLTFLALWVGLFDRLRGLDTRVIRGIYLVILVVLVAFSLSLVGQGLGILGG